jgi:hypothetical protein
VGNTNSRLEARRLFTAHQFVPSALAHWLEAPAGPLAVALVIALIGFGAGWLLADPFRTFILKGDDFDYFAESRNGERLAASFWKPHNVHIVPLFRVWCYVLIQLAGRLERLPSVVAIASFGVLPLLVLAVGRFVARETGRWSTGLAAAAVLALSSVLHPALTWYSAGQSLWAGLAIAGTLLALQAWRHSGGTWRLVIGAVGPWVAVAFWSGGYAAGPAGMAYLWADGRPRSRNAAFVPIVSAGVLAVLTFLLRGQEILAAQDPSSARMALPVRLARGTLHACQAASEALILGNLGLDASTTAAQAFVLCASAALIWMCSRKPLRNRSALEATGAALLVVSYLLAYAFRGSSEFANLRELGWYHAIPELGAILFAAGWLSAARSRANGALSRRDACALIGLVGMLLMLQTPRAERLFVGATPPRTRSAALGRGQREVVLQREILARLDRAQAIALQLGIGRKAIHDAFGRVLGPGVPAPIKTVDAAALLDLPWEGRLSDPKRVRAALQNLFGPLPRENGPADTQRRRSDR